MKTKRCSGCKETKPVSEFSKKRSAKDGLNSHCKNCRSEKSRRYYEANKEKVAERVRRYREVNKEKVAERNRKYREANKDKIAEKHRRWRVKNKRQQRRTSSRFMEECNARALEMAHRQGLPWEDWEDKFVLEDNGLTNYQKAVKLGRSYRSVGNRRCRLREKTRNELTNDTVRV